MLHHPHNIARQAGNLLAAKSNTGGQIEGFSRRQAIVHQGLKLFLIIAVAIQETVAGQFGNLLTQQALLIEAVTQPFMHIVLIEPQLTQHIIATEPLPVVGKPRIGFHQIVR